MKDLISKLKYLPLQIAFFTGLALSIWGIVSWSKKNLIPPPQIIQPSGFAQEVQNLEHLVSMPIGNVSTGAELDPRNLIPRKHKVNTSLKIDDRDKIVYFEIKTEDWNRENWSGHDNERIPDLGSRHAEIGKFTKVFLLAKKGVEIKKSKTQAFFVPDYKWSNMKSFQDHPPAQMIIQGGEIIIDSGISSIPFPFAKELYYKFIEHAKKQSDEKIRKITTQKFGKEYEAIEIPHQISEGFAKGFETYKKYLIFLDMNQFDKSQKIPLGLLYKVCLGRQTDPNNPNNWGYGELEDIINFSMTGGKAEEKKIVGGKKLRKIAFVFGEGTNSNIRSITLDGTNQINFARKPDVYHSNPCFSPNQDKILFSEKDSKYSEGSIWVMNADGSRKKRLTKTKRDSFNFSWSPDGEKIIYISKKTHVGWKGDIWVMNADGSRKKRLTKRGDFNKVHWSPDGKKLLGIACWWIGDKIPQGISKGVFILDPSGNKKEVYIGRKGSNDAWWSLDMQKIFFSDCELGYQNLNGGQKRMLTRSTPGSYEGCKYFLGQLKNELIIYRSLNRGYIYSMNLDNGMKRKLTEHPQPDTMARVFPLEKKIVFTKREGNRIENLWVMNLDGSKKERLTNSKGKIYLGECY